MLDVLQVFVDDVMFSCNAGSRPQLKMFCPVCHVVASVGRQSVFAQGRQVAAPGAKSAISDCVLFLIT